MLDHDILIWINSTWGHPVLDTLFSWLSAKVTFSFPLLALLITYLGLRYGTAGWKSGLSLLLVVIFSDGFGNLLKSLFEQARPCLEMADQLRGLGGEAFSACTESTTGMPSNHALNFFTTFAFLSTLLAKRGWTCALLIIAFGVALSRIYLGSHFPSQVVVGIIIGTGIGYAAALLGVKYLSYLREVRYSR